VGAAKHDRKARVEGTRETSFRLHQRYIVIVTY
jgi:hypothetical protein